MIANARRQTFHPSSLAFGEEEEQEHDTSCKSTVVLSKSVHSSSYIETCDGNESTVESPIWTKVVVTGIEKVLAICTNKEVIPFESMYGVDRLSKSTKVKNLFVFGKDLHTKDISLLRLAKVLLARYFCFRMKKPTKIHL